METVTLIKFKGRKSEWWSLLIDNISIARTAVSDIIGGSISDLELNDHAIYVMDKPLVDLNTAKSVFKSICQDLYKQRHYVMNYRGGHIPLDSVDWKEIERKTFEFQYGANLRQLLLEQNGKTKSFKEVKS